MLEAQGRLQGIFSFYDRDSKSWDSKGPLHRNVDAQKFKIFQNPAEFRFWTPSLLGNQRPVENSYSIVWDTSYFVQRKYPHTLSELARVATLDNCQGYCCLRSLELQIDELRIPKSEKEELKKLARGFRLTLEKKIPKLSSKCIHRQKGRRNQPPTSCKP